MKTDKVLNLNSKILLKDFEAAEALSISPKHFRNLSDSGKIPLPIKLGNKSIRWSVQELRDFVAAECQARKI